MEWRELTDRLNAIQDTGSRREEFPKANDRFAPRPTYRSVRDYPVRSNVAPLSREARVGRGDPGVRDCSDRQ